MLHPDTSARGREFFDSVAGDEIMQNALDATPKLQVGSVDKDAFIYSLILAEGWRLCLTFLKASVKAPRNDNDFDQVKPIDWKD
jgi:hypothetical protein